MAAVLTPAEENQADVRARLWERDARYAIELEILIEAAVYAETALRWPLAVLALHGLPAELCPADRVFGKLWLWPFSRTKVAPGTLPTSTAYPVIPCTGFGTSCCAGAKIRPILSTQTMEDGGSQSARSGTMWLPLSVG